MHILYVSQYFPPEMGAPAARVYELSRHWVQAGHRVTVLTGFPNHPTGVVHPEYRRKLRRLTCRERIAGIDVVRTWLAPSPNRKAHERLFNYLSFCFSSSLRGIFLSRCDVVIATSPQLFAGITGWWLARTKRVPYVLEIRDLWPESITASGMGTEKSMGIRGLAALARFLYDSSDHIVVVTPAFERVLTTKDHVLKDKVSVVENGVETEIFSPNGQTEWLRDSLRCQQKFVVSYMGTLGLAHGLDTVLWAAAKLQRGFPEILFLLVGEGADKERLMTIARTEGLSNLRFMDQQPRERIPDLIRASDVCLVPLKSAEVFKTVIPTKMLEFMSCGRPVVLGVDGQAREVLEEAEAGVFVQPGDSEALIAAIINLYHDRERRERLGHNGRRAVLARFSRAQMATKYIGVLNAIVSGWRDGSQVRR